MEAREFDHVVEIRDPKTGRVISKNDYVLRIGPQGREYERPPGSGMIYDSTGTVIRDEGKEKREQAAKAAADKAAADKAAQDAEIEKEKSALLAGAKSEADEMRRQIIEQAKAEAEVIRVEAGKASAQKKG